MTDDEFFGQYKHPLWQKKRLEIMHRDEWRCRWCGDDSKLLHVHHNYYKKGLKPWEYPDHAYLALCEDCHPETAERQKLLQEITGAMYPGHWLGVMAFAFGILVGGLRPFPSGGEMLSYECDLLERLFGDTGWSAEDRWHRDNFLTPAFLAGLLWTRQEGRLGGQVADVGRLNIAEDATPGEWLQGALNYLDHGDHDPDDDE